MLTNFGGGQWLNRKRLQLYTRALTLIFLILVTALVFHSNVFTPGAFPLGFDFSVFWSASKLALLGHAADAYQLSKLHSIIHMVNPDVLEGSYGWFYPPTYFWIISPLAYFPYLFAYLWFMGLTLIPYVFVVYSICRNRETLWCLAGFSGLWDNLVTGQNGFLTAALAGASLILLEKRPILAGVLIGLLSIKPQLILLFPVALIASKAWKTLWVAIITGTVFMTISTAALGLETFQSWLQSMHLAKIFLEYGGPHFWARMPTFFAFFHLLGLPIIWAYLAHLLVATLVIVLTWKIWKHCPEPSLRNAALTTGTLLISPYILIYDLTWLALPIAWMAKYGVEFGWFRWEKEVLILSWLLPVVMLTMAHIIPIQVGPWGLLLLLAVILRRARKIATPERNE